MPKYFAKLNKKTVKIPVDEGKSIEAQLLPISDIGEMDAISEMLANVSRENVREVQDRMIALISKSLPGYTEALRRFQLDELAELLALLMYGTNEPYNDDEERKEDGDGEKKD